MSEWQPIETAPKDDTFVLLATPTSRVALYGFWDGKQYNFCDEPEWSEAMQEDYFLMNSWREGRGPTHWMPLPSPPQEKNDE